MSNNKYIPLPGGKECKKVNPHHNLAKSEDDREVIEKWLDFDKDNPILAITEVMPEGVEFDGKLRYQVSEKSWKTNKFSKWKFTDRETYDSYRSDNFYRKRVVVSPIKAIEPVKEEANWKPDNIGSNPNECIFPTCTKENCRCFTSPQQTPSPNVVENKETVDIREISKQNFILSVLKENDPDFINGRPLEEFYDEGKLHWYQNGAEFGANWQQSQSIEGIVGFAVDYIAKHGITTGNWGGIKFDIIKEYNDGK